MTLHTRKEILHARAEQAKWSGLAWVRQHPKDVQSLTSENQILLTIEDDSRKVNCQIERIRDAEGKQMLQIIGFAEDRLFSAEAKLQEAISETQ